jgi:hypothetical protein
MASQCHLVRLEKPQKSTQRGISRPLLQVRICQKVKKGIANKGIESPLKKVYTSSWS